MSGLGDLAKTAQPVSKTELKIKLMSLFSGH